MLLMKLNVLSKFSTKVQGMISRNGKDLILSASEAAELNTTITELLTDRVVLLEEIRKLQEQSNTITEVVVKGGSFK